MSEGGVAPVRACVCVCVIRSARVPRLHVFAETLQTYATRQVQLIVKEGKKSLSSATHHVRFLLARRAALCRERTVTS